MKRIAILAFLVAFIANTGYSADIFSDGFESGTLTGWDVSAGWVAGGTARTGTYALYSGDVAALIFANRSINADGYSAMNVSFWAVTASLDAGEYVSFGWYNGSVWIQAMSVQTIAAYTYYSFRIPENATNPDFKIYFGCLAAGSGTETCTIDDVLLTGTAPPDTTAPNINSWRSNVTNNTEYSATQGYQFNSTISDTVGLYWVKLENNFSGTLANTTVSTSVGSVYYYNAGVLSAGTYRWRYWANDTSGNLNSTPLMLQIVEAPPADTTPPSISAWKANITNSTVFSITLGYQFNATIADSNLDTVMLEHNFTGARANLTVSTKNGNEYFANMSILQGGAYSYRWWANDTGGYLNSSPVIPLVVTADALEPNLMSFKVNVTNNSDYNAIQGYQFNTTVTDAIALYSVKIEHNFSGTLVNHTLATYSRIAPSSYGGDWTNPTYAYDTDMATYASMYGASDLSGNFTFTGAKYGDILKVYSRAYCDDGTYNNTLALWNYLTGRYEKVKDLAFSRRTNTTIHNITLLPHYISGGTVHARFNSTGGGEFSYIYVYDVNISSPTGIKVGNEYYYNAGNIMSGQYRYRWFGTDYAGLINSTEVFFYSVKPETVPPNITSLKSNVTNNSDYNAGQGYQFNATIKDSSAISLVRIEHNFSGTLSNYTVSTVSGSEYYYDYGVMSAGMYRYRWFANDTIGNMNNTEVIYYYISPETPSIEFISQQPPDIDSFNIFASPLNITYNFTGTNADYSSIQLYSKVNSTLSDRLIYINGSLYGGYGTHTEERYNSTPNIFHFGLSDVSVYPAIYNIDETYMHHAPKLNYSLSLPSQYIKTRLLNVSNQKLFGFLEFYAWNASPSSGLLSAYYCNSSYVSGNPNVMDACLSFGNVAPAAAYNHTYDTSSHYALPFPVNETSGMIGDVYVTPVSYILLRSMSGSWNIAYISNITRAATVQTSSSSGGTWSDFSGTTDMHLHQYDGTETFWYYASIEADGLPYNSTARSDLIGLGGMPPSSPFVYEPQSDSYYGTIMIAYTQSLSPNGYPVTYNISLYHDNYTYYESLHYNAYNLTYVWDASAYAGSYVIMVNATDSNGLSAYGFSEVFNITTPPFIDAFMNCTILISSGTYLPSANGTLTAYNQLIPSYYGLYSQNGTLIYESEQIMDKGVQNATFSAPAEQGAYYFKLVCASTLSSYAYFTVYKGFWDIPFEPLILLCVGIALLFFGYMLMRK